MTTPARVSTRTEPLPAPRRFSALSPRVVVMGASTGGPQALTAVLAGLAPSLSATPVVVVLHMPPTFALLAAEHLARATGLPVAPVVNGQPLRPGCVHLAGGRLHSRIIRLGETHVLAHSDAPPENFCKPAVDVLFRSAAEAFGPGALGVVLTGMGSDGLAGSAAIVEAGGSVIVQDEATSVVWGMPGAVARAGLAAAVAPLGAVAGLVAGRLRGGAPWPPRARSRT